MFVTESLAALTGATSISDVTLTGTATRTAGSDVESGNVTLKALGNYNSRMDLVVSNGTFSEVRSAASSGAPQGFWIAPNGSSTSYAMHNCLTDAVWFMPMLSVLAQLSNPGGCVDAPKLFLVGALSFWGPQLLLYALKRKALDVSVVTSVDLCVLLFAYFIAGRFQMRNRVGGPSRGTFMLLGIWILGPTAMLIAATLQGAGFFTLGASSGLITAILGLFPPYTFVTATYDGSLYALIIASILLMVFHFVFERENWIIPPRWSAHLRSHRKV